MVTLRGAITCQECRRETRRVVRMTRLTWVREEGGRTLEWVERRMWVCPECARREGVPVRR